MSGIRSRKIGRSSVLSSRSCPIAVPASTIAPSSRSRGIFDPVAADARSRFSVRLTACMDWPTTSCKVAAMRLRSSFSASSLRRRTFCAWAARDLTVWIPYARSPARSVSKAASPVVEGVHLDREDAEVTKGAPFRLERQGDHGLVAELHRHVSPRD